VSSLPLRSSTRPAGDSVGGAPAPQETVWDARRILIANLVVLGVATCFALLYRFAAALFILFAGVALGMAVKPGVERLRKRGLPRWAGALAIYTALAAAMTAVLVTAVPVVLDQVGDLIARAPRQLVGLRDQLLSSESRTLQRIAVYLPPTGLTGESVGPAADAATVARYGAALARGVLTISAVLLLGFYWTLEGERRTRTLLLFAPLERRRAALSFVGEVEHTVGGYLRGQSLVCLIVGGLAFVLYRALGLPHPVMLGLVYAIGEAVPVVGPIAGTAVAAIAALAVHPARVIWVGAVAVGVQLIENYLLVPRIMVRAVGVNPLVTLLAITAFGSVLGIAGAVLAIPMAAIVQLVLYRSLLDVEAQRREPPPGRDRLSVVRYGARELVRDMRKRARRREQEPRAPDVERLEDAVEGIAVDLEQVVGERDARG